MRRHFTDLDGPEFDLLVIGGGVLGAWTAYDAALRGLRVALVEKTDWAAGTSSCSSKLIHGGLRYLEYGRLAQVRGALRERRRLLRLAPHRVQPLRFVVPVYRDTRMGRLRLRAGLWIYDRLARGADNGLEHHSALTTEELQRRYEFVQQTGLTGALTYSDCQTDDARYVLEIVDGAAEAGAVAVNRAEVTGLVRRNGRVVGGHIRDGESGEMIEVRAAMTINCTGAWATSLMGAQEPHPQRLSRGVHLVLPALPTDDAFLLLGEQPGRVVFLIPWHGRTLVGTTDTDFHGSPEQVGVDAADRTYLLRHANRALARGWREEDIIAEFAGLRTLPGSGRKQTASLSRECDITEPREGLLASVGGKLGSGRCDAERLVSRALARLGRRLRCSTGVLPFPWSPENGSELQAAASVAPTLDPETALSCRQRYGSRLAALADLLATEPELGHRLVADLPFCRGEIVYAVRHEMARNLPDILRRRVPLALLTPLDEDILDDAATLAGRELGWSPKRRQEEVESMTRRGARVPVTTS